MRIRVHSILGIIGLASCCLGASPEQPLGSALDAIRPEGILAHIKALSGDAMEGRLPGTPAEERAVSYLVQQCRALGLKPGNPDGTYLQEVPLVGFQASRVKGSFLTPRGELGLEFPRNLVAVSRRGAQRVEVANSDVVFVGYGVVAPEYGWDDYKGLDTRGKTLVMLVGDPAVADTMAPDRLDPSMFKGKAMTYYGRWTYKYEIAAEKQAAAVIIVHEDGPAGYPFSVVQGSNSRENFDIAGVPPSSLPTRSAVEAWIDLPTAKRLFESCGRDFNALKQTARSRDFRPVSLDTRANFEVENKRREVRSHNVVARLEGSDPTLDREHVVYTAHWDHLGRDPQLKGDQIFNGAADNASGVAGILEIARGITRIQPSPRRSMLFLFVTAEEKGLLGSKYYATHPLYPLRYTLADINVDVINLWGKTRDIVSVGMGQSTLDDLLVDLAASRGRTVGSDTEPEKGMYYRSDHFEFAKQGVPALDPKGGDQYIDKPAGYGQRKRDEYTQKDYHKPSDEVKPDWDLAGAVEDLQLLLEVGYRVAQGDRFPTWKPDSEFRARREAMLKAEKP